MNIMEPKAMERALCNPVILSCVFEHLDFDSLKAARRCCRSWSEVAKPFFKKKSVMTISKMSEVSSPEFGRTISNFVEDCKALPSLTVFHTEFLFEFFNLCEFKVVVLLLRNQIKSLVLWSGTKTLPYKYLRDGIKICDLEKILILCPNLESLTAGVCTAENYGFAATPGVQKPSLLKLKHVRLITYANEDQIPQSYFTQLFQRTPQLESFSISGDGNVQKGPIKAFVSAGETLRNLSTIEVKFLFGHMEPADIQKLSKMDIKLVKLRISGLEESYKMNLAVHHLLSRHKRTLKDLAIDELRVPVESIMQLSQLQTFDCQVKYDNFNRTDRNSSVNEYDFGYCFGDLDRVKDVAHYFIALKKISLRLPTNEVLATLIQAFGGSALEDIMISFDSSTQFDSIFCGISTAECEVINKLTHTNFTGGHNSGISTIKELRRLTLNYEYRIAELFVKKPMSTALLFCGLASLKKLTNVTLCNFLIPVLYLNALPTHVPLMFLTLETCYIERDVLVVGSPETHFRKTYPGVVLKVSTKSTWGY